MFSRDTSVPVSRILLSSRRPEQLGLLLLADCDRAGRLASTPSAPPPLPGPALNASFRPSRSKRIEMLPARWPPPLPAQSDSEGLACRVVVLSCLLRGGAASVAVAVGQRVRHSLGRRRWPLDIGKAHRPGARRGAELDAFDLDVLARTGALEHV